MGVQYDDTGNGDGLFPVEGTKKLSGWKGRDPVVQRVVVHVSSLAEGTRFIRPLTVGHLMRE